MKVISHRGNVGGPNKEKENLPSQILFAINKGFDVEVDVWCEANKLFLGHDSPQYEIQTYLLENILDRLWIHCKNFEALEFLQANLPNSNYFWHQSDDFTLTSKGYIWTYPGKKTGEKSVIVDLSDSPNIDLPAFGICTDYPERII